MDLLDIHTHHSVPYPEGIVNVDPVADSGFIPDEGQLYSVGIHPWHTAEALSEADVERLREWCAAPWCVAVGESGVDMVKGGPMFRQLQMFRLHVELSESLEKPLVIHDVKAHDVIIGLHSDMKPRQPWVIHGFRGKPTVARMFWTRDIYLSMGEKFNNGTMQSVPADLILAETDCSQLPIERIITSLSEVSPSVTTELIRDNTLRFLGKGKQ